MRSTIRDLKEKHTVLISSHILPEIHQTCDRLLVLRDGELVASGTEDDLSARLESFRIAASVTLGPEQSGTGGVEAVVNGVDGVHSVEANRRDDGVIDLSVEAGSDIRADVSRALVNGGYGVIRIDRADMELEEVFLQLVHGNDNGDR
jgi:ABC-2 type transport system ATP-binding protein